MNYSRWVDSCQKDYTPMRDKKEDETDFMPVSDGAVMICHRPLRIFNDRMPDRRVLSEEHIKD